MIHVPNIFAIQAGEIWLHRQGMDVHLRNVPAGESVVKIGWGAPKNSVYLTLEDIRTLARLADSLDKAQLQSAAHVSHTED